MPFREAVEFLRNYNGCERDAPAQKPDDIRRRFGDSAIMIASTAGTKLKRDQAREMLAMPVNMYI